jgi:hypothetical protein
MRSHFYHSIVLMILFVIDQKVARTLATVHRPRPHQDLFYLSGFGIGKGSRCRRGASLGRRGNASGPSILLDDLGDTTLPFPAPRMAAPISWRQEFPDNIVGCGHAWCGLAAMI